MKKIKAKEVDVTQFPNPLTEAFRNIFIRKGLLDEEVKDDVVGSKKVKIPAKKLKPSQNAIYLDRALMMAIVPGDKFIGGPLDAVISKDNYILDGHHRWASTMLANPDALVEGVQIDLNIADLIPVLRTVGDALNKNYKGDAGRKGASGSAKNIFSKSVTADDIMDMLETGEGVGEKKFYNKDNADAFLATYAPNGKTDLDKRLKAIQKKAPPKGVPPRVQMPVINPGKQVKQATELLRRGLIDIRKPYYNPKDKDQTTKGKTMDWRKTLLDVAAELEKRTARGGKSVTPKYVVDVEQWDKRKGGLPFTWEKKYGKPNAANLAKFCESMNESMYKGGVNEHLGLTSLIVKAVLRENKPNGRVLAKWKMKDKPMFVETETKLKSKTKTKTKTKSKTRKVRASSFKKGDTVKVNIQKLSDKMPPYVKLVKKTVKNGGGSTEIMEVNDQKGGKQFGLGNGPGDALLGLVWVNEEALVKASVNVKAKQSKYVKMVNDITKLLAKKKIDVVELEVSEGNIELTVKTQDEAKKAAPIIEKRFGIKTKVAEWPGVGWQVLTADVTSELQRKAFYKVVNKVSGDEQYEGHSGTFQGMKGRLAKIDFGNKSELMVGKPYILIDPKNLEMALGSVVVKTKAKTKTKKRKAKGELDPEIEKAFQKLFDSKIAEYVKNMRDGNLSEVKSALKPFAKFVAKIEPSMRVAKKGKPVEGAEQEQNLRVVDIATANFEALTDEKKKEAFAKLMTQRGWTESGGVYAIKLEPYLFLAIDPARTQVRLTTIIPMKLYNQDDIDDSDIMLRLLKEHIKDLKDFV